MSFNQIGYQSAVDLDLVRKMTVPLCPLEYCDFCIYLELDEKIDKSEIPSAKIRSIAYETIDRRYLSSFQTHIYTDESLIERVAGAGAGIYCNHFTFYKAVERGTTNFDGEAEA